LAITALGLHDTVIAVDDRTIDIEAATAAGIEGPAVRYTRSNTITKLLELLNRL